MHALKLSVLLCAAAFASSAYASSTPLHFPPSIAEALDEGVTVKLVLMNQDGEASLGEVVIGDVMIKLKDKKLSANRINIQATSDGITLNETLIGMLKGVDAQPFDSQGKLIVSDDAFLQVDGQKMQLKLFVSETAFGWVEKPRVNELGTSSVGRLSTILDYNMNAYSSRSNSTTTSSGYLNLKSTTSIGEDHLLVSGSLAVGTGKSKLTLDDVMYERDMAGRRLAVGKLSGWSMQALGNVSTLDGNSMYGFSYGNSTKSSLRVAGQSLTPIVVYMPSPGEARIIRDGKVLDIQRLPLGSHELDTTRLPSGIYDVTVEVVVGGVTQSSRVYRVNKTGNQAASDTFSWEVWGGATRADEQFSSLTNTLSQRDDSWGGLYGVSMASRWNDFDWSVSLYRNRETEVEEAALSWQVATALRVNLQNLYASDGARRMLGTLNLQLPANLGSLWYTRENGDKGRRLNSWSRNYDSVGASLSLGSLVSGAGTLALNYEKERNGIGQRYLRADYNQLIYSGRWGSAQLQLGMNQNSSDFEGGKVKESSKYIALNLSIPLGADFTVGFTHEQGGTTLDLGAGIALEDSTINYLGADVSMPLGGENTADTTFNTYANYAARYGSGTISLQGGGGNSSFSLSNQGSIALTEQGLSAGNARGDAGVVIKVPDNIDDNKLEALVGSQAFPLKSGSNLISLPSFASYDISLRNSAESEDSYNVLNPPKSYTLYPGNVLQVDAAVQRMVTVFGRLTAADGKPLAEANVRNHIGMTKTDSEGNFSIDVNRAFPQLVVESEQSGQFDIAMELDEKASGAVWIGDLVWSGSKVNYKQPSDPSLIKN